MDFTSSAISAEDFFLSMTCVAPRDLTSSSLRVDVVAMMGENPESLASCIAA
jgi:hypothetical protein